MRSEVGAQVLREGGRPAPSSSPAAERLQSSLTTAGEPEVDSQTLLGLHFSLFILLTYLFYFILCIPFCLPYLLHYFEFIYGKYHLSYYTKYVIYYFIFFRD